MANDKIAIFPAAGGLGGSTYNHLLNIVKPEEVILIARYASKIPQKFRDAGLVAREADYDKPETLAHAFDGASCLNLISYASIEHEHRSKVHKDAIDAARRSGVKHIIYSSLAFGGDCEPQSAAHVMQAHLDTEKYLASIAAEDKTFTYTAVRQGLYSESFPIYTAFFDLKNPSDEITVPYDGSGPGIAWAKRDELGEATARLISQYRSSLATFEYVNKTILLSGPRVWSYQESVDVLSKAAGKKVTVKPITVEKFASLPQVTGGSDYGAGESAKFWASAFEGVKNGETAVASPLLAKLLGREPEPFEKTVQEMAKA
ncbi:uncharacterized protein K452DRAFT_285681 [Aplosporella prunicola CBS 121167]|uniref:NmrA-like domain-containing protein n=1 Tax=Aplosporella prunicola CBS 121167 TaxID=1176127 RepID=A0A6A6BJ56_9PEZI|nr:uncharacterized protein K452DRAFT_285681 [Aplosporella prunicola CBS 121167]KAF2143648.1 hypothetical protein K452DRAFT_285681 [Aplosporella prunicola CBS 121167]